jgi:GNAT superfamily N-acetyltransferase
MLESPSSITVRQASESDAAVLFDLIGALADYEQLSHEVVGSVDALADHMFGDRPCIDALIASKKNQALGFALFFPVMNLEAIAPGIYLEDLFVHPNYRRQGIGKVLLSQLAQWAIERNCGYLEWSVLDWNQPAIAFYRRIGALISDHQRTCRLTPAQLTHLAPCPEFLSVRELTSGDQQLIEKFLAVLQRRQSSDEVWQTLTDLISEPDQSGIVVVLAQQHIIAWASFSQSYSTFLTQPGLLLTHLEIHPDCSSQLEVLQAVLSYLATLVIDRRYGRLEWRVSNQAKSAIAQANQLGATLLDDWRICHVPSEAIATLAGI